MKQLVFITLAAFLFSCSCPLKNNPCATFEEMTDSMAVEDPAWESVEKGLQLSWGSIDNRYAKTAVPQLEKEGTLKLTAWKGERVAAQLVLWSAQGNEQVVCSVSDFNSGDSKLSANIANTHFVRYVMSDEFGKGCGKRKAEEYSAQLSADMLDNIACMDIPAKTVRPVWISIDVPFDAQAGSYTASVSLAAKGEKKQTLQLELEVIDKVLPPASEWAYHLDLWQHPTAVARWHQVELWSQEHFALLQPLMGMLANAGQKVITTNLNKDPWNGQCYDRYATMIQWTKKKDGNWEYDFTVFDTWVEFMMNLGVNKMINCYSMVPWNHELDYLDEDSGEMITVQAVPGTEVFTEMWTPFLHSFVAHLQEKGWLAITNIAMDERAPELMKATIGLLQKEAPGLGIALADNHKSYKEYPFIKDLCTSYGSKIDEKDLQYRKEKGLITTYYVCCSHVFPNQFTFSEPAESVYAAWHTAAVGYDGFLRWAYNSWVENPLLDSRFRTWPSGDTYLVYPDARSSIRFERLREGIQDVEKIRVLKNEWAASTDPLAQEKLLQLNQLLSTFVEPVNKPEIATEIMLKEAKQVLNSLAQ